MNWFKNSIAGTAGISSPPRDSPYVRCLLLLVVVVVVVVVDAVAAALRLEAAFCPAACCLALVGPFGFALGSAAQS